VSDFDGLHSRRHDDEVQLYAFDCLALEGDDLRKLPLTMRKTNLARLLARRADGIFVAPFEQGEIGPDLFRKACEFGLEGLVSKHRDRAYRGGTSPNWLKVKNPRHPPCSGSRRPSMPKLGIDTPDSVKSNPFRDAYAHCHCPRL
jgi:bifunctional non-homologous end joining protein LigD